jgi:hypothetical protein
VPAVPARRFDVKFRAKRVDVEGELDRLEMSGNVVVSADRYRLTSDHVVVTRGPRGLELKGEGRLAFCRCESPPIQIGFQSATVAPPTDLLVEDPTLRIAGVPVCWLPYFWLRSPTRVGLLPPRLSWRGDDGLLVGAGVHLPLDKEVPADGSIDVTASGYLEGGAEVTVNALTRTTTSYVRWDHLRSSFVVVDAHGAVTSDDDATVSWRVDAIRGGRARRGLLTLDEVSRRYDRVRFSLSHVTSSAALAFGAHADTRRAEDVNDLDSYGPLVHLGLFAPLSRFASSEGAITTRSFILPSGEQRAVLQQRLGVSLAAHLGPLSAELAARQWLEATTESSRAAAAASVAATARLSLPLVRHFADPRDPVRHWIEPLVEGVGASLREANGTLIASTPEGEIAGAFAGLRTSLGRQSRRWAAELDGRAGLIGYNPERGASASDVIVEGRASATTQPFGVSSRWAASASDARRAHVTTSRLRLGPRESLHVAGYAEGRTDAEPILARWVGSDRWAAPRVGYYDDDGWSVGGEVLVPWTRWLASSFSTDYDLTRASLLGMRGSVAYRHPCGCLAVVGWAGHRLGRDAVDASVSLDLMP